MDTPTPPRPAAAPKLIGQSRTDEIQKRKADFYSTKNRALRMRDQGLTNADIALALGKSESVIHNLIGDKVLTDATIVSVSVVDEKDAMPGTSIDAFTQTGTGMSASIKMGHLKIDANTTLDIDLDKDGKLPPMNLESPDGERVLTVTDLEKAQSMVSKGWKVTDRKKTPYVASEHLTDRPLLGNPALQALKKSLQPEKKRDSNSNSAPRQIKKQRPAHKRKPRRNYKENN